jgi:hypothetical protein
MSALRQTIPGSILILIASHLDRRASLLPPYVAFRRPGRLRRHANRLRARTRPFGRIGGRPLKALAEPSGGRTGAAWCVILGLERVPGRTGGLPMGSGRTAS